MKVRDSMPVDDAQSRTFPAMAKMNTQEVGERAVVLISRLQRVTAALSRALTIEDVAEVIVTDGVSALEAKTGVVGSLSNDGTELTIIRSIGLPCEVLEPVRCLPITATVPATEAARTGEAVWLESPEALARRFPDTTKLPSLALSKAWAVIPLVIHGNILGVMSMTFAEPRAFETSERTFIQTLAEQCAQALERARLYEAERTAREQAQAAILARDDFISIASHELKTPVTGIKAAAQLVIRFLDRGTLDEERLRRYAETISASADRLAELTNDLLDVSRIQSGRLTLEMQNVNLAALVRNIVEQLNDQVADSYRLLVDVPDDGPHVLADPGRIEQVLVNLLDNAVKYTPSGGTIQVILEAQPERVILRVVDPGIGLPRESLETIFQPFHRAPNATQQNLPGMGLGLYICREIIERHGGFLRAESLGENRGTTMIAELPRKMPAAD